MHRRARRSRVLVVCECTAERDAYTAAFLDAGYSVLLAATPNDACRLSSELPADAIVIDVRLSLCPDGIPLARRLRECGVEPGVPMVILAGRSMAGSELAFTQAGARRFVAKPCPPHVLAKRVAELIAGAEASPGPLS